MYVTCTKMYKDVQHMYGDVQRCTKITGTQTGQGLEGCHM